MAHFAITLANYYPGNLRAGEVDGATGGTGGGPPTANVLGTANTLVEHVGDDFVISPLPQFTGGPALVGSMWVAGQMSALAAALSALYTPSTLVVNSLGIDFRTPPPGALDLSSFEPILALDPDAHDFDVMLTNAEVLAATYNPIYALQQTAFPSMMAINVGSLDPTDAVLLLPINLRSDSGGFYGTAMSDIVYSVVPHQWWVAPAFSILITRVEDTTPDPDGPDGPIIEPEPFPFPVETAVGYPNRGPNLTKVLNGFILNLQREQQFYANRQGFNYQSKPIDLNGKRIINAATAPGAPHDLVTKGELDAL